MQIVFWLSIFLIFYAYFGYPLSLMVIGAFRGRSVDKREITPHVTFLVTACNEEARIRDKLENTLNLIYPADKLQILVASDGSTDATNAIVNEFQARGVELLAFSERRGKEMAQKDAVQQAEGEVIVFSDVATMLDPTGLKEIVANFADPSVGCVSSEDRVLTADGSPAGEGSYVRYEMWLRRLESRVSSLVGLSGSFFAARKEVCRDFSGEMQSDFRTVLSSIALGLRGVSDPKAIGYYRDVGGSKKEFERKVRTVLRGMTVFFQNMRYLNPVQYGLFAYQYFCHKLLRWLVPLVLLVVFIINTILALSFVLYFALLLVHIAFYSLAIIAKNKEKEVRSILFKLPLYFVSVNLAIGKAWMLYVQGERMLMWKPSQR
jgi:cellulose synthase/poly-beta-1,6-N-acetylglucosamine synthase-like glycosyltransferase